MYKSCTALSSSIIGLGVPLACGAAATGLFWALRQLLPWPMEDHLWDFAYNVNQMAADSLGAAFVPRLGYVVQQLALFAVGFLVGSLLWARAANLPTAGVAAVLVPWLANTEALVIAIATAPSVGEYRSIIALAVVVALTLPLAGLWCIRHERLVLGPLLGVLGLTWAPWYLWFLNSPAPICLQWGSVALSWALFGACACLLRQRHAGQ